MFRKCVENRIIRNEGEYKCYLCYHVMKDSNFDVVEEHINSNMHQKKLKKIDEIQREAEIHKLYYFGEPELRRITENLITYDRNSTNLKCHVCFCQIPGLVNTLEHIKGNTHIKNYKALIKDKNGAVVQKPNKESCDKVTTKKKSVIRKTIVCKASATQLRNNGIIWDIRKNTYYCYYCKAVIIASPNISEHIKGSSHQTLVLEMKTHSIDRVSDGIVYNEKLNTYECQLCNEEITCTLNFTQHIQGYLHLTSMIEAGKKIDIDFKSISQECLDQNISDTEHSNKDKEHLEKTDPKSCFIEICYCNPCQNFMYNNTALKCHSMLHLYSEFVSLTTFDIIKVKVMENKKLQVECLLCKSLICKSLICDATQELEKHLNTNTHRDRLLLFKYNKNNVIVSTDKVSDINLENAIYNPKKSIAIELSCNTCNVPVFLNNEKEHIFGKNHMKNLSEGATSKSKEIKKSGFNSKIPLKYYTCFICDKTFSECASLLDHLKTPEHQWKIVSLDMINKCPFVRFIQKKRLQGIECPLCKVITYDFKTAVEHMKGRRHKDELISLSKLEELKNSNNKSLSEISEVANGFQELGISDKGILSTLDLKNLKFKNTTNPFNRVILKAKSKKKIKKENKFEASNKELGSNLKEVKNSNDKSLSEVANGFQELSISANGILSTLKNNANNTTNPFEHAILKSKSSKKIKKKKMFEASNEELNQLGFSTENIQPLTLLEPHKVDDSLGDLLSLDFNKSQIRKLPSLAKVKSPRTPKVENTRNSFAMNVSINGKTFIKYCIDPGNDNIYNFDYDKINLLKLGITLTFPYHTGRVCIPCGEQFSNEAQSLFEHLQNQEHLKNICNNLVDDKVFEDFPEQFSDLRLAKLYMRVTDQSVHCHACNVNVGDDDAIIRQHANTSDHQDKSKVWKEQSEKLFNQYSIIYKDIWYYAEVFFCEICKKRYEFEIDFATHLIQPEHMKKVYTLKYKGTALKFDLCPPCITYWYGKADSYKLHCESNFHKRLATNKDFMVPNLTVTASEYLDNVDANADFLISESDKVDMEKERETTLLETIVEIAQPIYPNAKAYVFGSRLSHLALPDSDVDIFLDCKNVYSTSSTRVQNQQWINSIKEYFIKSPNTWLVDEVLLATRIPIMKLRHIPTNLKCDISFVNGLSVEKSQLVGMYNRAFPICRKLILFMKKWLTLCRLFGSEYITSFAISWCVIFYLQSQGILPSVHKLINRKMESKIVDGWECGFEEVTVEKSSNLTFKEHLKGFFIYFAKFDYQKNVVCPYLGKCIEKHKFAYSNELLPEMAIYQKRLKKNQEEIFRFDSPMCIQDPVDLSQNLTKAVKKQQLRNFRQYCILSAEKSF